MNAVFDEKDEGLDYAREAIIPAVSTEYLSSLHESYHLDELQKVLDQIGASVSGEDIHV